MNDSPDLFGWPSYGVLLVPPARRETGCGTRPKETVPDAGTVIAGSLAILSELASA